MQVTSSRTVTSLQYAEKKIPSDTSHYSTINNRHLLNRFFVYRSLIFPKKIFLLLVIALFLKIYTKIFMVVPLCSGQWVGLATDEWLKLFDSKGSQNCGKEQNWKIENVDRLPTTSSTLSPKNLGKLSSQPWRCFAITMQQVFHVINISADPRSECCTTGQRRFDFIKKFAMSEAN